MISKRTVKRFCKDYYLIENYQQAVNDKTQTWDCHHKRETDAGKSKQQLIDEGLYYDVNPDELIFLTKGEHRSLHKKGERHYLFGKHHSDETKQKISEANKHKMKQVMCVETGEVFESLSDAARRYNLFYGHIGKCCNGKRKSCGGLHWQWNIIIK